MYLQRYENKLSYGYCQINYVAQVHSYGVESHLPLSFYVEQS